MRKKKRKLNQGRTQEAYRELVDVDLDELDVGERGGHLLQGRLDEAAGPAPRRREVDHCLQRKQDKL